jgi:diguanylate cyclase (GGDEF)-like protein
MEASSYVRGDLAILEAGFAALGQAVLVHDNEGTIVACNPAAARLAGRPVDEILGRRAGDFEYEARFKDGTPVTPDNSRLLRCIRTGEPQRDVLVELRAHDSNTGRWVVANYQPLIHEGADRPWGAVASFVPVPGDRNPRDTLDEFSRHARILLESGDPMLSVKDLEGRYLFMNRRLARELGIGRDEAIGRPEAEVMGAEIAAASAESDQRAIEMLRTIVVDERLGTGPDVPTVRTIKFPLLDDEGTPYAVTCVSADVTAVEHTLSDLAAQLDLAPGALLSVDRDGHVAFANRDARELARESDDLQLAIEAREPLAELLAGEDPPVAEAIEAGRRVSLLRFFERPDGSDLWLAIQIVPLGTGSSAMCSLRDVTEEREREEELSHQAFHDSLTGLPNRRFTEEQLSIGLARARRQRGGLGVVFLDIDDFKSVNDRLGHAAGDEVLIEFAERLTGVVRETDAIGRLAEPSTMVARRGGDEFVLVLTDLPAEAAEPLGKVMERIEAALGKPFSAAGRKLELSASLGAAAYPHDAEEQGPLLDLANAAMREAKRHRREVRISEPPETG